MKLTYIQFPDVSLADPAGMLAIGGELSPSMLVSAYRQGIFPWTADPVTWWSPDPRAVFPIPGLKLSKRTTRFVKNSPFKVTFDKAFRKVMEACAKPTKGRESTWIHPDFIHAYSRLYDMGFAHSAEAWLGDELAGGVYGVAIGGLFAGESMFHTRSGASTVALCHLFNRLDSAGFKIFDSQVITDHTRILGAFEIPRESYIKALQDLVGLECQF